MEGGGVLVEYVEGSGFYCLQITSHVSIVDTLQMLILFVNRLFSSNGQDPFKRCTNKKILGKFSSCIRKFGWDRVQSHICKGLLNQ
jgi:hypothetical protein